MKLVFGRNKKKEQKQEEGVQEGPTEDQLQSAGNIRALFRPATTDSDSKMFFRSMLQSDKDNYVKARIPSAFNMTVFDLGPKWTSGDYKTVSEYAEPDPSSPDRMTFSNLYRPNSMALGGLAREEGVRIAVGASPYMWMDELSNKGKKLKEGDRK